ncbi:Cytochrome P450 family protein [Quillaja saponaria]|uniref:Cytochrome P450 family protein n=1 Tax=Quillaja saponaria TaxID=32244 RepID=A0AAD7L2Q5_QUISA|nr:Cytochrome P450 family protein [Quillaja saponaria]
MEISYSSPTAIAAAVLGFLLLYTLRRTKSSSHKNKAPVAPGGLPLIGHLHLLAGKTPIYQVLANMADKVGSVFIVRLGTCPALIISSPEVAKECFTINDKIFASRPKSSHGTYICYDYSSFGMAPYGPLWRDVRKIVVHELLSTRRLDTLNHYYVSEISTFMKDLYSFSKNEKVPVIFGDWFERFTLNITTNLISAKRYFKSFHDKIDGEAAHLLNLIKDVMFLMGRLDASDLIPVLGLLKIETQVLKSMKRVSKDFDILTGSWLKEHTMKERNGETTEPEDFIDVMLSMIDESCLQTYGHSRDTIIKATIMSLIVAGADTTSVHLTWLLSLLLNNRDSLKRAQEELDRHVGRDRWVEISDLENLTYLHAIAKETLRLYVPGPILIPHVAREDCEVGGYHIAKGTQLIVNAWKLHRDPNIWSDPERFLPERFLTTHAKVDAFGQHFEFLPFGSGRRACPGSATPMNQKVDLTSEGLGLTLYKATPLEVFVTPRLPTELYL